jgi:serine 3-dehydrogenase (NADP+)
MGISGQDIPCPIRRTAIDDDVFPVRIVLRRYGCDRVLQRRRSVTQRGLGQTVGVQGHDLAEIVHDVDRLVARTLEAFGRIDLLVYATATNIPDRALDVLTPETWETMLRTNLTGAFLSTPAVLPAMRANGGTSVPPGQPGEPSAPRSIGIESEGGLIVYLSTAAVQLPDVSGVAYQASKHGLTGLAHGTRIEEKSRGIRTTVIYPGLCDTEILAKRPVPTPPEVLAQALDPQDVADAVLFVAGLPERAVVPEMQLLPSRL